MTNIPSFLFQSEIVTDIINKRKVNKLHIQDFKLYLDDIDDCKIPLETLENYLPQQQEHYLGITYSFFFIFLFF
jgi:hypothetical protein